MSRSSLSLQLGVILLVICLFDVVFTEDRVLRRQKRGFRLNSQDRIAHGYGKRGYMDTSESSGGDPFNPMNQFRDAPGFTADTESASLMSVREFAQLLQSHPNLATALLRKFVDIDGDDVISTEELFRPALKK